MNDDRSICRLLEMQEKLTLRKVRGEERNRMPPEVADLDRDFSEKRGALEAVRERTTLARTELEGLETRLAEANDRLKKFQAQSATVATPKEYSAALNQIDGAKREIKECEERLATLREKLATDEAELATREAAFPAETSEFEKQIADWRAFQDGCDAEIAELDAAIATLESGIPKDVIRQFRQLLERRGGLAVVRVTGPSCGGCNVRLRPALYQSIRIESRRKKILCETCGRILVFPDELSSEAGS